MKTRLYINLTNQCNVRCPFCCMYSAPDKNTFIAFNTVKGIVDETTDDFEFQLEGGEPLLHKDFFLFLEYAVSTGRCTKIIILSNGILVNQYLKRIVDFANWNKVKVEFKLSLNYFLIGEFLKMGRNIFKEYANLAFAVKYITYVDLKLNVRLRNEVDEHIREDLKTFHLDEIANVFYLQAYGRMTGSEYDKPVIVQNIDEWRIFASDGRCFEKDLIARSEYEKGL